jgi:hypothetical protein
MQESWEFDFKPSDGQPITVGLGDLIEKKSKEVGIYLSYYYRGEGGLVEQVALKDDMVFKSPTTGSLKVNFYVIYYNACLNIHSEDNKDEMTLHFEIDTNREKVKFTGPHWPQREPDEI